MSIGNGTVQPAQTASGTVQKRPWTAPRVSRVKLSETANAASGAADGTSFS